MDQMMFPFLFKPGMLVDVIEDDPGTEYVGKRLKLFAEYEMQYAKPEPAWILEGTSPSRFFREKNLRPVLPNGTKFELLNLEGSLLCAEARAAVGKIGTVVDTRSSGFTENLKAEYLVYGLGFNPPGDTWWWETHRLKLVGYDAENAVPKSILEEQRAPWAHRR